MNIPFRSMSISHPYLHKEAYNKLTNRWETCDDIIATLAPFAFRNTKYFKMGKNLLNTSVSDGANIVQTLTE